MDIDLTEPGRWQHEPHWRRYLSRDGVVIEINVQDFDYGDYDAERFLDRRVCKSQLEAQSVPVDLADLVEAALTREGAELAVAMIRKVIAQGRA